MRYIDPEQIRKIIDQKKPDWKDKAIKALQEIEQLAENERSKEINNKSEIWREIKDILSQIADGKCWYCESKQDRSDNAVDHFRPKSKYWWLAFCLDNYRFSCTYCNSRRIDKIKGKSGGKQDNFPLLNESQRALLPTDDYEEEQPLLLDPLCIDDPPLLWFNIAGEAEPKPELCHNKSSYPYQRVMKSIELYHLNHSDIVERRTRLYAEIEQEVIYADKMGSKVVKGDNTARSAYQTSLKRLKKYLSEKEQDSAAAKVYILILSRKYSSAKTILQL